MKVNELLGSLFVRGGTASFNSDAGVSQQAKGGQTAPEAVAIGGDAVKLEAGLSSQAANDPGRASRIAQLKAQVSSGTYNPDRSQVAASVVRELL
jgi:anti-sigma28 factor (negative regulator of flagellin synthesis)